MCGGRDGVEQSDKAKPQLLFTAVVRGEGWLRGERRGCRASAPACSKQPWKKPPQHHDALCTPQVFLYSTVPKIRGKNERQKSQNNLHQIPNTPPIAASLTVSSGSCLQPRYICVPNHTTLGIMQQTQLLLLLVPLGPPTRRSRAGVTKRTEVHSTEHLRRPPSQHPPEQRDRSSRRRGRRP